MEPIQDFAGLICRLRSLKERKRVVVVCPNDPHTEYVITRIRYNAQLARRLCRFLIGGGYAPFAELGIYPPSISGSCESIRGDKSR